MFRTRQVRRLQRNPQRELTHRGGVNTELQPRCLKYDMIYVIINPAGSHVRYNSFLPATCLVLKNILHSDPDPDIGVGILLIQNQVKVPGSVAVRVSENTDV